MSMLLIVGLAIAIPLVGVGLLSVQNRLEFWTQQKHEKD
jgi:hypothetical protein